MTGALDRYLSKPVNREVWNGAAKVRQHPAPAGKLGQQPIDLNNRHGFWFESGAVAGHDRRNHSLSRAIATCFIRLAICRTQPEVKLVDFFGGNIAAPCVFHGERMRDAESFVISRLMWFDTPRSTATHNRARERHTAEIQPVSAVAQVVQQSGPRTFWERGSKWIDEQSKPIYVELREQFLFGKKLDCETGEPLLQNIPSKLAALNFRKCGFPEHGN